MNKAFKLSIIISIFFASASASLAGTGTPLDQIYSHAENACQPTEKWVLGTRLKAGLA